MIAAEEMPFPHEVPSDLIRQARAVLPACPVICDIGSRDALDGIYLAKVLDVLECHMFEPNETALELCRRNIEKHGEGCCVFLNPVALSDMVGSARFYPVDPARSENRDIGFSSMLPINPSYASKRRGSIAQGSTVVPTTTLDSYFSGRGKKPDLLWIDVEGAELLVLKGARSVLDHVRLIHVEVSFRPMQLGKPLFREVDRFLREQGFRLLKFPGVSRLRAFLVTRRLLPNLPWRWNAIYGRQPPA